jgi:hypothetical protein
MSRLFRFTPLLSFAAVYLVTCVAGACVVLVHDHAFAVLFEYFSGTPVPRLAGHRETEAIVVLAAPLLMIPSYVAGLFVAGRIRALRVAPGTREAPAVASWLPYALFAATAVVALVALGRAGSFGTLHTWTNYGSWVDSRQRLFARIGFFSFVDIYTLVPLTAAWCAIAPPPRGRFPLAWRAAAPVVALGISLLLFQKKAPVVTLIVVAAAFLLAMSRRRPRHVGLGVAGAAVAVAVVYFALVVAPVYSSTSQTVSQAMAAATPAPGGTTRHPARPQTSPQLKKLGAELQKLNLSRREALVVYSLFSPITRSSVPALYYPLVFPRVHGWFHLDLGLDILGYGTMPNDNVVVWNAINPTIPGTVMVPYNFVLFSQGGVLPALLGSLVIGFALGLVWAAVIAGRLRRPWRELVGALVVLFAIYIAIDSLRDSLTVSYGLVWGFLFLGLIALARGIVLRIRAALHGASSLRRGTTTVAEPVE